MSQPRFHSASALPGGAVRVLLVAFLLGHTPLLPVSAGLVAALEGGHAVELSQSRSGVALTLHHERCDDPARRPGHAPAVDLTASLAPGRGHGTSDHVVEFPAGDCGVAFRKMTLAGKPAPDQTGSSLTSDQPLIAALLRVRNPGALGPGEVPDGQIATMLHTVRMLI